MLDRATLHSILPGDTHANTRWLYNELVRIMTTTQREVYSVSLVRLNREVFLEELGAATVLKHLLALKQANLIMLRMDEHNIAHIRLTAPTQKAIAS